MFIRPSQLPYYLGSSLNFPMDISLDSCPNIDPDPIEPAQGETVTVYRWAALNKNDGLVIQDLDEKAFLKFAALCDHGYFARPVSRAVAACGVVRINTLGNFLQDFFVPLISHEIRNFKWALSPIRNICQVILILVYLAYLCIRMSVVFLVDIATFPIRLLTLAFRIYDLVGNEKHPLQKQYNLPDHVQIHCLAYRVSLLANKTDLIGTQKQIHYKKEETKLQLGFDQNFVPTPAYKNNNYCRTKTQSTNNASLKIENIPTQQNLPR